MAYREVHVLLEELADATLDGARKDHLAAMSAVPLLILTTSACASSPPPPPKTCSSSSCAATSAPARSSPRTAPVDDWGKLLGDTATISAMLDRLLHHAHVLKCGPKSWRIKLSTTSSLRETGANR